MSLDFTPLILRTCLKLPSLPALLPSLPQSPVILAGCFEDYNAWDVRSILFLACFLHSGLQLLPCWVPFTGGGQAGCCAQLFAITNHAAGSLHKDIDFLLRWVNTSKWNG